MLPGISTQDACMHNAQYGFTLVQLLAAIAVIGCLTGMAWSGYRNSILDVRQLEARSRLADTLLQASTQSLASGRHAVICPAIDASACTVSSTDWSRGWIAFIDRNGNRQFDPADARFAHVALTGPVHITSSSGRTRIVYQPNGAPPGSNLTFTLCDTRGHSSATTLVMGNSGQWRSSKPSKGTTCPIIH